MNYVRVNQEKHILPKPVKAKETIPFKAPECTSVNIEFYITPSHSNTQKNSFNTPLQSSLKNIPKRTTDPLLIISPSPAPFILKKEVSAIPAPGKKSFNWDDFWRWVIIVILLLVLPAGMLLNYIGMYTLGGFLVSVGAIIWGLFLLALLVNWVLNGIFDFFNGIG